MVTSKNGTRLSVDLAVLHVAPDGMVWVPGFGSGVFGKFNPTTEQWTVYELPDAENQIPYALNVDSKGIVWICGTHNDTINRFDPKTETFTEIRLPTRVSYTREIEFDDEGNVWTSTSGPARHMERGVGAVIRIALPDVVPDEGSIQLVGKTFDGTHDDWQPCHGAESTTQQKLGSVCKNRQNRHAGSLQNPTSPEVCRRSHGQPMPNGITRSSWERCGMNFAVKTLIAVATVPCSFGFMEYVANQQPDSVPARRFIQKWQHHNFGSAADRLVNRSMENGKRVYEQAACNRCHTINGKGAKYGPDLTDIAKRFKGSKLLQQCVKPSAEIHKEYQTQQILAR